MARRRGGGSLHAPTPTPPVDPCPMRPPRQSFNHPDFPQRLGAIERPFQDTGTQLPQLGVGSRPRETGVPHVVGEIEVIIIHPHWMVFDWNVCQALAIARNAR